MRKDTNMKTMTKSNQELTPLAISRILLAIAILISTGQPVLAEAGDSNNSDTIAGKYAGYRPDKLQLESEKNKRGKDVVLDFTILRDSGLAIKQLKELAIHIFDECTREVPALTDCREATGSTTISTEDIDKSARYLKPRSAWIFFYIATFEPIMQLFRADTQTSPQEEGKLLVPKDIAPKMDAEWSKLDKAIAAVDKQIDKLSELLDDDPDNSIAMAQAALEIYERTMEMEAVRQELYLMLQQSKIKGVKKLVAI